MPKKEQIPQGGTKLPQKPMPKQDKGGGINLTAEGACIVFMGSKRRGCKTPPRCLLLRPLLATKTRETRVWNFSYNLAYKIDEVKQRVYTYNKV